MTLSSSPFSRSTNPFPPVSFAKVGDAAGEQAERTLALSEGAQIVQYTDSAIVAGGVAALDLVLNLVPGLLPPPCERVEPGAQGLRVRLGALAARDVNSDSSRTSRPPCARPSVRLFRLFE